MLLYLRALSPPAPASCYINRLPPFPLFTASCNGGYTYLASRCYQNCPSGWYDDLTGISCQTNSCNSGDEDNGAGMCEWNGMLSCTAVVNTAGKKAG